VTNIRTDRLSAEDIARTYTARWLVELAFRELKGQYRIDQMPSAKRAVVETLGLRRLHRPACHDR
jgi:IS4 transposase